MTCPGCGSPNVLPIMYGLPGDEMIKAAELGKVKLGGCCIYANMPTQHCGLCGFEWSSLR